MRGFIWKNRGGTTGNSIRFFIQVLLITDDGLILRDRIVGDNSYRYVNWLFTKKAVG